MPSERMTLTDIANHVGTSRVTMYTLITRPDFPARGDDRRWDRPSVMDWLAANTVPAAAVLVAGVLVRA